VTDNRVYCRLNPFEEEYLEKKQIGFSEFVHKSFYSSMKNDFYKRINKLLYGIVIILLGCIILTTTYLITIYIVWLVFFLVGVFIITIGFINFYFEVKNVRKQR